MPRFAVIRPNSSNAAEFISSWMAFGSSFIDILAVGALSVLKPQVELTCMPSLMRTYPSHLVRVLPGALQSLLTATA